MGGRGGNVGKEGTFPRLGLGGRVQDELYSVVPHSVREVVVGITAVVFLLYSLVGNYIVVELAVWNQLDCAIL